MAVGEKNKYFVCKIGELLNGRKLVTIKGLEVGIFHVDGNYYAWRNVCPHAAAPVCEGKLCGTRLLSTVYEYQYGRDGEIIRCPWHGWEFDLKSGKHLADENVSLKSVELLVQDDDLFLIL